MEKKELDNTEALGAGHLLLTTHVSTVLLCPYGLSVYNIGFL